MSVEIITQKSSGVTRLGCKISGLLRDWAAATYAEGGYPHLEMQALADAGLMTCILPGEPLDLGAPRTGALLKLLHQVGAGNLSVGRIYEGHINALQLIARYADEEQRRRWFADARHGHLFGVWNTQGADGVTVTEETGGRYRLAGSKTFCSGSVQVTRPIVTGELMGADGGPRGWQMTVVPLDRYDPPVDQSFWTTSGMRNSVSYKIDFTGIDLTEGDLLGRPDDYNRQPYLSGGAVRFAAVQLGGAASILDHTRTYLQRLGRTDDAYQQQRIGQMVVAVESGKMWLERAGSVLDSDADDGEIVYTANQVRTAIADYCRECLELSDRSVGARGMLPPEPLSRLHDDLRVYLRQPAPDAALGAVGKYFLDGLS